MKRGILEQTLSECCANHALDWLEFVESAIATDDKDAALRRIGYIKEDLVSLISHEIERSKKQA